ncbi:hypothetical protein HUG10_10080 [Halorarum halophilum]|uniref:Uncharacterized protein n=1 Tax=Halorarum halophilum TaxID=2743090 RepID=A0A7D5K7Y4_9EURY|nr:hypothetical protein [Halobaculum halophilum]QLG27879.1 hypothetical protein HUG10_10080 [Halobaculum halophilum]
MSEREKHSEAPESRGEGAFAVSTLVPESDEPKREMTDKEYRTLESQHND